MGISLKWKIIVALTLVPMISLGIYLGVTYISFKSDRLAYIYESTLAESRLLTKYATENISAVHALLQQWSYVYKQDPINTNESVVRFIKNSPIFEFIKDIHFVLYDSKEKKIIPSQGTDSPPKYDNLDVLIDRFDKQEKSLFLPTENPNIWVMFSCFKNDSNDRVLVFTTMNNGWIRSQFPGQIVSESFWLNDEGKLLNNNSNLSVKQTETLTHQVLNTKSSAGAFLFSSAGGNYIAAFSFSNKFAIFPIIVVKTTAAYEAVNILLEKSFIVLVLLISIAVLIGLFLGNKLTASLEYLLEATKTIAKGNFDIKLKLNSGDEIEKLAKSFNVMITQIRSLLEQNKEVGRMEAELNLAKIVQAEIQPKTSFNSPFIQLEAYTQAASECSGDWWSYFETETDFFVLLGDATGHGASAALFTSAVNSLILLLKNMDINNPKKCLELMNNALYQTAKGKKSITLSFLKINKNTGKVIYSNASHEFPFLFRRINEKSKVKDISLLQSSPSHPLGYTPNAEYEDIEFQLENKDILVLYTDGIIEARNSTGNMWGERKFLSTMLNSLRSESQLGNTLKTFINHFYTYTDNTPLADDATVVILRFNP